MSEECTHDCSTCSAACGSREGSANTRESFIEPGNPSSNVKKIIAVVSGKGGVGKTMVTSRLAVAMRRRGKSVAVMDADITGPSIPCVFGIRSRAMGDERGLLPAVTKTGIGVMSMNLLLEDPSDPVVWRGPIIGGVVGQFWKDVYWGDVDYMFVDMPPGTGDVPLTVFQTIPVSGIIIVTSPQELVSVVVEKAIRMAELMEIPVLGIVENMSYFECPDCGKRHSIYGESHVESAALAHGIKTVVRLPIDPSVAAACDAGAIEDADTSPVEPLLDVIEVSAT